MEIYNGDPGDDILIDGIPIRNVENDKKDAYKYLGIMKRHKINYNPHDIYRKCTELIEMISKSALHPWQKIDAYKTFVHSKLIFYFRIYKTAIGYLNSSHADSIEEGKHRGLNFVVRQHLRTWTGLSHSCTPTYMYAAPEFGGLGLIELQDEYSVQSITTFHKLMNCSDIELREVTREELCQLHQKN